MSQISGKQKIKGKPVDEETRCVHYHSALDVIAIKFKCCGDYYPCYQCHQESAGHPAQVWDKEEWSEKAILCGVCGNEMSIQAYFDSGNSCPHCKAPFNPGCSRHYHLYFKI